MFNFFKRRKKKKEEMLEESVESTEESSESEDEGSEEEVSEDTVSDEVSEEEDVEEVHTEEESADEESEKSSEDKSSEDKSSEDTAVQENVDENSPTLFDDDAEDFFTEADDEEAEFVDDGEGLVSEEVHTEEKSSDEESEKSSEDDFSKEKASEDAPVQENAEESDENNLTLFDDNTEDFFTGADDEEATFVDDGEGLVSEEVKEEVSEEVEKNVGDEEKGKATETKASSADEKEDEVEAGDTVSEEDDEDEDDDVIRLIVEDFDSEEEEDERSEDEDASVDEEEAEEKKKKSAFKSLFSGLNKTRKKIGDQIDNLLNNYSEIDDDLYEEIEDILITADIGMKCTMELIDMLKEELVKRKVKDASKVKAVLRDVMADYLKIEGKMELVTKSPTVILVIGVNGAGKTTSIGKISHKLKSEGKKVVLAAADTFRAAAIDQLKVWAERAGVSFVAHEEGSDPSAVIFDGIKAAQARNADVLICDTAGRLHNKVNLMNELNKMFRIIEREYGEANKEVLLVLDATTGQNAVNQAKEFLQTAGITGVVLTKLDGTAKGGFVFAIKSELGIPVKLIGVGEKIEDLQEFDAENYASAVLNIE